MPYSIGIGILPPDDIYTQLRQLELQISEATNNNMGLIQPPHITVKRPFIVPDLEKLEILWRAVQSVASKTKAPKITYQGCAAWPNGTIYLKVEPSKDLAKIHFECLSSAAELGEHPDDFEGKDIIFHTSLALEACKGDIKNVTSLVNKKVISEQTYQAVELGIFMNINGQWIITHKALFTK